MGPREIARLLRLLAAAQTRNNVQEAARTELLQVLNAASRGGRLNRRQMARLSAWLRSDAAVSALESLWAQDVGAALDDQSQQLVRLAERTIKGVLDEPGLTRFLDRAADYLDREGAKVLTRATAPLIDVTAELAALSLVGRGRISFDLLQPGILEFTEREAAWLITEVTDTTKRWVQDEMKAALQAGESTQKIARRIRENRSFGRWRSELIARTETTRVSNGSRQGGIRSMIGERGGTATKTRVSAGDERVRPEHRRLNRETRPLDQPYSNGEMFPGDTDLLCRCTEIYAFADALNLEAA